jgi:sarcosine oxidase, subunit alpha
MSEKVNIQVNGQNIKVDSRVMLLEVLNERGIYVPQLCNHPALAPSGSCRLCVVEITKKEWNGSSKIVTSCLYPAEEGLIVSTLSEAVLSTRRSLLELYLARSPGAEEIRKLARMEGIDSTPFTLNDLEEKCILCGLCTRVCQDYGPGAIATLNRGADKAIGANPDGYADDCTGCRACASICPTGAIPIKQEDQVLTIWNHSFKIPICTVNSEKCRGCGICEEVCPFSIPRVNLYKTGLTISQISPTTCVGCGICAGACPTGAISQLKTENLSEFDEAILNSDLKGKTVVFTCPRSPMPDDEENLVRVSCIDNIDISTMLYIIAAGAQGIALICRDRHSCPYQSGGGLGERRLIVARDLLAYVGLDTKRLALLEPLPGYDSPLNAWLDCKARLLSLPDIQDQYTDRIVYSEREKSLSGMDRALAIIGWLKKQPALKAKLPAEISSFFTTDNLNQSANAAFDRLPELYLLLPLTIEKSVVLEIIKAAVQLGNTTESEEEKFTFVLKAKERKKLLKKYLEKESQLLCFTAELCLQYALLLRAGSWQQSLLKKPIMLFSAAESQIPENECQADQERRIKNHPILPPLPGDEVPYFFNGCRYTAREGEVITSALYAAGVTVFGHHHKDGSAQGIYCVNGQCSQCMVIADGKPVKGCMVAVTPGMQIKSVEGLPALNDAPLNQNLSSIPEEIEVDVLIIGGGPAGISAAIELGNVGVETLIIDDKQELGGKLSLQTHNFFGSVADCYAGYRGVHIGHILADELKRLPTISIWYNSTVVGVFSDGKFGVSGNGTYKLVKPKRVLFSTGAREKSLAFPGADLPGVYGAGAFQTLVNRDLVRCAERLFIIGGGNVGLIGAYHALQAGIDVVGLVEALPKCGGYKVHEDKIKRLGVPVWTSHTVLRIEGDQKVERVIVAAIDEKFQPIKGSERCFAVDTVLIAVGLSPVNELLQKAREYGIESYAAGDAEAIAEASAAIFSGKIIGRRIAQAMGIDLPVPSDWEAFGETLKQHSSESEPFKAEDKDVLVYPLIRCMQNIPCNPCTEVCPNTCISMPGSILALPEFGGECIGCGRCVLACPGLAINLVVNDYDPEKKMALLMMPYEFLNDIIPIGKKVATTDMEGNVIGKGKVIAYKDRAIQNSRRLILIEVPYVDKLKVAGFRIREVDEGIPVHEAINEETDPIVCRCERVRKSEIVQAIRDGVRDMNQLKAVVRAGLGGCNGKTCTDLILRIFREEGVELEDITMPTHRPLIAEVHLGDFVTKETGETR